MGDRRGKSLLGGIGASMLSGPKTFVAPAPGAPSGAGPKASGNGSEEPKAAPSAPTGSHLDRPVLAAGSGLSSTATPRSSALLVGAAAVAGGAHEKCSKDSSHVDSKYSNNSSNNTPRVDGASGRRPSSEAANPGRRPSPEAANPGGRPSRGGIVGIADDKSSLSKTRLMKAGDEEAKPSSGGKREGRRRDRPGAEPEKPASDSLLDDLDDLLRSVQEGTDTEAADKQQAKSPGGESLEMPAASSRPSRAASGEAATTTPAASSRPGRAASGKSAMPAEVAVVETTRAVDAAEKVKPELECCSECKVTFKGGQQIYESTGDPPKILCQTCWEEAAPICISCKKSVLGALARVGDDIYHHDCLKCEVCKKSISSLFSATPTGFACSECQEFGSLLKFE
ncbi:unnamed protein product [Polarella glacialis]|uniref:LIM zinc-binding domain-containing protein n=1 Tax=Polarella glacialis TaxID=89957 RepID=A0A813HBG0_POLGL|nr:unnamed protein product [Polarella glacialis]